MRRALLLTLLLSSVVAFAVALGAQGRRGFTERFDHPAIQYPTAPRTDAVADLIARAGRGELHWPFDPDNGYLRPLLDALHVPVDSQVAVYSQTSLQASRIGEANPRAIYFNDSVAVGWVRGGSLEIAALDPRLGVSLYEVPQVASGPPRFVRGNECLQCHITWETRGIPGFVILSTGPPDSAGYATGGYADHRTPFARRWGGWLVTGSLGSMAHMGNVPVDQPASKRAAIPPALASLTGRFDPKGYLSMHSDVVALMVLEHQSTMANLLIWLGWQARVSEFQGVSADLSDIVRTVVDYMLFVDEAPLPNPIKGSGGFTERFSSLGPKDHLSRSFHQLDLNTRLLKYPCSYMIDTAVFEALPAMAKAAVYDRMWQVLSGAETGAKYQKLKATDRKAISEILAETRSDWPKGYRLP